MPAPEAPAPGNLTSGVAVGEKGIPTAPDPVGSAECEPVTPPNEKSGYDSGCTGLEDMQDGIKKVEAIASVWTKKELIAVYAGCAACLASAIYFLIFFLGGGGGEV